MKLILAIGAGGFAGSVLRYLLSLLIRTQYPSVFPWGTLAVNILGCFVIGVVYGIFERGGMSREWHVFVVTGVLGGFTTFSAFSHETAAMLRDGLFGYAGAYVAASVIIGLLATFAGILIIKSV